MQFSNERAAAAWPQISPNWKKKNDFDEKEKTKKLRRKDNSGSGSRLRKQNVMRTLLDDRRPIWIDLILYSGVSCPHSSIELISIH